MALSRITRQTLEVLGSSLGEVRPRDPGTIFPPFLRNDWSSGVEVTTSWMTDMRQSEWYLREDAVSLKTRPTLSVTASLFGTDNEESFQHLLAGMRLSRGEHPVPLWSDFVRLTAAPSSVLLPCDPSYRRFYPGQRVGIVKNDWSRVTFPGPATGFVEYGIVDQVTSRGILLTEAPVASWGKNDMVYPMIDCLPLPSLSGTLHTDHHMSSSISVTEFGGMSNLPPTFRELPEHLYDVHTVNNETLPVVSFNEWTNAPRIALRMPGGSIQSGKGMIENTMGYNPLLSWQFSVLFESREKAWELQQLFDACRGRGRQMFFINPLTTFDVKQMGTTYVKVGNVDNMSELLDGQYIKEVGIEMADGERVFRRVDSITADGDDWRLNFDQTYNGGGTPVRVSTAHQARFGSDSLTFRWLTDQVCECSFEIVESRNSLVGVSVKYLTDGHNPV